MRPRSTGWEEHKLATTLGYIIKDLSYALALAESAGVTLEQATTTRRLMERTMEAGYRDNYYTAVIRTIAGR